MKNLFKIAFLFLSLVLCSCGGSDDAPAPAAPACLTGSFMKGQVGSVNYDSSVTGGQSCAIKTTVPFAGDQIAITSVLSDTKTLNLTFFVPPTLNTTTAGILFYSPNGSAASSIGNDDNCSGVSCSVRVLVNDGKKIEGTYTASLKKFDCSGPTTVVTNGTFKAVLAL